MSNNKNNNMQYIIKYSQDFSQKRLNKNEKIIIEILGFIEKLGEYKNLNDNINFNYDQKIFR